MKSINTLVVLAAFTFTIPAYATDPVVRSAIGGAIGGAGGAAVGQQIGGKGGAVAGAAVGGALGGATANCGSGAVVGGAVGGAAGAAIGQSGGGKTGAVVGGGAGGAAGAAIGCDMTDKKRPVAKPSTPAPFVTVVAAPVRVEGADCGRKHNKGKGWAKGHTKC